MSKSRLCTEVSYLQRNVSLPFFLVNTSHQNPCRLPSLLLVVLPLSAAMEKPTEFEDWELLHSSDDALYLTPKSADGPEPLEPIEAIYDDNGMIKSGYFALDSGERYAKTVPFEGDAEVVGLADSGNSDSRRSDRPIGELGLAGIDDLGGFRSDESPDGRNSLLDSGKGVAFCEENSKLEVGCEVIDAEHQDSDIDASLKAAESREIEETERSEMGYGNQDELASDETVRMEYETEDSKPEVDFSGIDAGQRNSDNEASSALAEEIEGGETGNETPYELGYGESVRTEDNTEGNSTLENISPCEGERKGTVWLKLPIELLKFCVLKVRPVWSISIAAGIIGIFMLGRRLYKMKRKSRSIPLKVSMDDKKASQLRVHAARLNEAFSVVRRVPIIRSSPSAGGVTLWPVVGLS